MQEMAKLVMLLKKRTFCVCRRDTHTHQVQIRPCQSRAKKAVTSEIPFEKSNTAVFSCASEKPDESSRRFFSERRRGSRQNFFACFRGSRGFPSLFSGTPRVSNSRFYECLNYSSHFARFHSDDVFHSAFAFYDGYDEIKNASLCKTELSSSS